jgi:adenylate kinase
VIVVVFGPPAGGKGTQSALIAERFAYPHISTGDILRSHQERRTALGDVVTPIMSRGDLVPDHIITHVTDERLSESDALVGAVLDGVPRTAEQARLLDELLAKRGVSVDFVITLDVPEPILRERARHRNEIDHRVDDAESAFEHRLEKYRVARGPLIEHYSRLGGRNAVIDGTGTVDEVAGRIAGLLALDRATKG